MPIAGTPQREGSGAPLPERRRVSIEKQLEQSRIEPVQERPETMPGMPQERDLHAMQRELDAGLLSRFKSKKKKTVLPPVRQKDEVTKKIETVMSEGLMETYRQLPQYKQVEFRIKGEETARAIRGLMQRPKLRIKKLLKLLFEWLKILPGVNRFFIEQEAKLKAQRIMELHESERARRSG